MDEIGKEQAKQNWPGGAGNAAVLAAMRGNEAISEKLPPGAFPLMSAHWLLLITSFKREFKSLFWNITGWLFIGITLALFVNTGEGNLGYAFKHILGWTLVWAFFATFSNYFLGIIVALLINKKGIKFKKMWRGIFVLTIAVPQFISLLYMSKLFAKSGLINAFLMMTG